MCEQTEFLTIMNEAYETYLKYGPRSSKKVDIIHNFIKKKLEEQLQDTHVIILEKKVKCLNASGYKACDIVAQNKETGKIDYIIPVKFVCSNYKQNKNNYFENLIGETYLLKHYNKETKIIPFNIMPSECKYFNKDGVVKKMEKITKNDISVYTEVELFHSSITYIVDIDYENNKIEKLNDMTPYKDIKEHL